MDRFHFAKCHARVVPRDDVCPQSGVDGSTVDYNTHVAYACSTQGTDAGQGGSREKLSQPSSTGNLEVLSCPYPAIAVQAPLLRALACPLPFCQFYHRIMTINHAYICLRLCMCPRKSIHDNNGEVHPARPHCSGYKKPSLCCPHLKLAWVYSSYCCWFACKQCHAPRSNREPCWCWGRAPYHIITKASCHSRGGWDSFACSPHFCQTEQIRT